MTATTGYAHIVTTPGVCGGRPRVEGHRIRVQDVAVAHEWQGLAPDEICTAFPSLKLAEVHSALAYYFDHRDEIQQHIQDDGESVRQFRQTHPDSVR